MFPAGSPPPATSTFAVAFDAIMRIPGKHLTDGEKLTLLALQRCPDKTTGTVGPFTGSNATLGRDLGKSPSQARAYVAALEAKGWLAIEYSNGGTHRSITVRFPEAVARNLGRKAPDPAQDSTPTLPGTKQGGCQVLSRVTLPGTEQELDKVVVVEQERDLLRSPDGGRNVDFSNDNDRNDPDACGPLRLIPAPEPEAIAETVGADPQPDPEPPLAADPPPEVDPAYHDQHVSDGPPERPAPVAADEEPAALLTPRAMAEHLAEATQGRPETSDQRARRGDLKRARQMEALKQRIAATPKPPEPPPRPPAPPMAPPEPEVDPPPTESLPPEADSTGAKAYLSTLDAKQKKAFWAVSTSKRLQQLQAAANLGPDAFRVLREELNRSQAPAAPPSLPETTGGLIRMLPGGDPALIMMVAQAIAIDFRDAKSWRAFEGDARAVWKGTYPAEQLAAAYQEGMNPDTKNPGAVYNHALKRAGWKSRRGHTSRRRNGFSA